MARSRSPTSAFLNGNFVASDASAIWSSPDGQWLDVSRLQHGRIKGPPPVTENLHRWLSLRPNFASADAINWTQSPATNVSAPVHAGEPLTFAGGYFVALANTLNSNLMVSTNGQGLGSAWIRDELPGQCDCFGNNTFVAVGNGSVIVQSDILTGQSPNQLRWRWARCRA